MGKSIMTGILIKRIASSTSKGRGCAPTCAVGSGGAGAGQAPMFSSVTLLCYSLVSLSGVTH